MSISTTGEVIWARQLRLALVSQMVVSKMLSVEGASEILQGPLTPGDDSTKYDDSALLGDKDGLDKIHAEMTRAAKFMGGRK